MTIPAIDSATTLDGVLECISAQQLVWVRLAAIRRPVGYEHAGWQQLMLDLVAGEVPPEWMPLYWRYRNCLFIASDQAGSTVANWFRDRNVCLLGANVELPEPIGPFKWERHDSESTWGSYQTLPWPSVGINLGTQAAGSETGPGDLVAEDAPTFSNYYAAASYVFNHERPIGGGRASAAPTFRVQDISARIGNVQIAAQQGLVRVVVEGNALEALSVELCGDAPGPRKGLSEAGTQTVDFAVEEPLSQNALVVLRSADRLLDRRSLVRRYGRDDEPGVEYLEDPANRLQQLIFNREGFQVDFKETIPHKKDQHSIFQCMKSVAAFANGSGGVLLFGVNNDEQIVGVGREVLDETKGRLTRLVSSWVEPRPIVSYEEFEIDDRPDFLVLGMRVEVGSDVPYMVGVPGETKVVYIRHYSDSVPARQYEIQRIVASRAPRPTAGGLFAETHRL